MAALRTWFEQSARNSLLGVLCVVALVGCGATTVDTLDGGQQAGRGTSSPASPAVPGTAGVIALVAPAYTVNEGAGTLTVELSRTGGSDGAVEVNVQTSDGSAVAGTDYTAISQVVSWAAGDGGTKSVTIPITDDSINEPDETFSVSIGTPVGGATLGSVTAATITIVDNDAPVTPPTTAGSIRLSASVYSVNEGAGVVTVTLQRVSGTDGAVGVTVATGGGTATSGSDYTGTSQTVSWADGDGADKSFAITIIDDSLSEPDETFNVSLSAPTGGATLASPTTGTVTIVDNDAAPPPSAQPLGYYTDLVSAPVGAFVTAYGSGFGNSGTVTLNGMTQSVVSYTDSKVVFVVSGSGGPLVVGGKSLGNVSVHTGRVIEVTPSGNLKSIIDSLIPGDTVYLRAGTYSGKYDSEGWNEANFSLFRPGTAAQPIALVAYPGDSVTIRNTNSRPNFHLGNSGGPRRTAYMTIAGFNLVAPVDCIDSGANTANSSTPESGAAHVRAVANTCTLTDATSNTMTGMFAVGGDDWKVLGNTFINPSNRVIINNNHGIYVQNGADDVEVAYNVLRNLRMGHVIQVHQDGTPMLYENVWIHDNLIESANNTDTRGMTVSNVDSASTVLIERNTLRNLGQDFSGIAVYRGIVTIRDNLFYAVRAPNIDLNGQLGGTRSVTATGNRFETVNGYPAVYEDNGASMNEITLSANRYCGPKPPARERQPAQCR